MRSTGTDTTHFSVLDDEGNRVAGTITLNAGFGTGLVIPGTGLLLNNQMDDFSVKPGVPNIYGLIGAAANAIAPRQAHAVVDHADVRRERTRRHDRRLARAAATSPAWCCSRRSTSSMARARSEIVAAPRIHHQYQPDVLAYEKGALTPDEQAELQKRGHKLRESRRVGQPAGRDP